MLLLVFVHAQALDTVLNQLIEFSVGFGRCIDRDWLDLCVAAGPLA